jgi:glutamate-5-semialdehyde dehydrogenase
MPVIETNVVEIKAIGARARVGARALAKASTSAKNVALGYIADALVENTDRIVEANQEDYRGAKDAGESSAILDRLLLDAERIKGMAEGVRGIAALPDPIGQTLEGRVLPNGLRIAKRRVPLGVIGTIYESRPDVTIDIAALCIKSGNAVILRGGKEAFNSNSLLASLVRDKIAEAGIPKDAVQFIESTDRALVGQMLGMKEHIDLMIPRGGAALVRRVGDEATMPAITGGIGVCHTYVDRSADVDMAVDIAVNAKISRPYVCNALDTLLVDSVIAPAFLPKVASKLGEAGVELHCDARALSILGSASGPTVIPAIDDDWGMEFLSLTAAVKVVDSLDEALEHIETYTSGHTEAIVTEDYSSASRFQDEVDASVVMVNASTRFNDGGQFGMGAEVGISTDKFHARGPLGLNELTSYKWTMQGTGQIRE